MSPAKKSNVTPAFRNIISSARRKEIFIPRIRTYLYQAEMPGFTVEMPESSFRAREPDGWFHPSTHPSWTPRQLFYYLTEPGKLVEEPLDMLGTMATIAGTFWHAFLQAAGLDDGVLEAVEVEVEDPETGSHGSMDGRLCTDDAWEFKTMNPNKLATIHGLDDFIERCPTYYLQAQEYLRLSGLRRMVVIILSTSYPFEMKEVIVPVEPAVGARIRDKYLLVRQAVADGRVPEACCSYNSAEMKECPARSVCSVAIG